MSDTVIGNISVPEAGALESEQWAGKIHDILVPLANFFQGEIACNKFGISDFKFQVKTSTGKMTLYEKLPGADPEVWSEITSFGSVITDEFISTVAMGGLQILADDGYKYNIARTSPTGNGISAVLGNYASPTYLVSNTEGIHHVYETQEKRVDLLNDSAVAVASETYSITIVPTEFRMQYGGADWMDGEVYLSETPTVDEVVMMRSWSTDDTGKILHETIPEELFNASTDSLWLARHGAEEFVLTTGSNVASLPTSIPSPTAPTTSNRTFHWAFKKPINFFGTSTAFKIKWATERLLISPIATHDWVENESAFVDPSTPTTFAGTDLGFAKTIESDVNISSSGRDYDEPSISNIEFSMSISEDVDAESVQMLIDTSIDDRGRITIHDVGYRLTFYSDNARTNVLWDSETDETWAGTPKSVATELGHHVFTLENPSQTKPSFTGGTIVYIDMQFKQNIIIHGSTRNQIFTPLFNISGTNTAVINYDIPLDEAVTITGNHNVVNNSHIFIGALSNRIFLTVRAGVARFTINDIGKSLSVSRNASISIGGFTVNLTVAGDYIEGKLVDGVWQINNYRNNEKYSLVADVTTDASPILATQSWVDDNKYSPPIPATRPAIPTGWGYGTDMDITIPMDNIMGENYFQQPWVAGIPTLYTFDANSLQDGDKFRISFDIAVPTVDVDMSQMYLSWNSTDDGNIDIDVQTMQVPPQSITRATNRSHIIVPSDVQFYGASIVLICTVVLDEASGNHYLWVNNTDTLLGTVTQNIPAVNIGESYQLTDGIPGTENLYMTTEYTLPIDLTQQLKLKWWAQNPDDQTVVAGHNVDLENILIRAIVHNR